jgi:hypothetical protein
MKPPSVTGSHGNNTEKRRRKEDPRDPDEFPPQSGGYINFPRTIGYFEV